MERINILDESISNKIAAGEVVERPASAVKELLENSIDAGAKNIIIEIENGGKSLIRIIDDGHGIYKDDLKKAFSPHGTSKIKTADDINVVKTMGFRGEALPSIAAVSKVKLSSKTEDGEAHEICIEGGNFISLKETAQNKGTVVEVRDIFYNVPARLKFLKSTGSETSQISDIINRLALAHKEISFKYINNGKKSLNTYGTSNLEDVIREVYGKNVVSNLTSFEAAGDILTIYGYIGNREAARGNRNHQSIFVNKRYIKSRLITAAVENAFKSFITVNSFPFFIVFIDVYAEFTDVNVHPTKSEIKFKDDRLVYKTVFDTVHNCLKELYKKDFAVETTTTYEQGIMFHENGDNKVKEFKIPLDLKGSVVNTEKSNDAIYEEKSKFNKEPLYKLTVPSNESHMEVPKYQVKEDKEVKECRNEPQVEESKIPPLNIIGQFNKTYILGEYNLELYMIDQHAAHEKILFEKYKEDMDNSKVISQMLLSPYVLELSGEDFDAFKENQYIFKKAGFLIEEFGDNTIIVKEVPMILGSPNLKVLFMDILESIKDYKSSKVSDVLYLKIATIACKAAIKANDELSMEEMKNLLLSLGKLKDPYTCPHGRPTIIKITLNEIEKRFKRIV